MLIEHDDVCRHNKMMIDMAMVYVEEHRIRRHGVVLRGVRDQPSRLYASALVDVSLMGEYGCVAA